MASFVCQHHPLQLQMLLCFSALLLLKIALRLAATSFARFFKRIIQAAVVVLLNVRLVNAGTSPSFSCRLTWQPPLRYSSSP
jgi:hypothetical protein